ncbi:hypothetical protein AAFF_G00313670 [Aldrovandia affinis]|uniref:Anterior gradient protein 2 homolog n=1 Tax=Aldrovandia affinis TaxID=143900 RepID=A0AAD7R7T1_9TELE|nr:hypothetical protein AAFF_G00313670 [Aldrovandia affinis]
MTISRICPSANHRQTHQPSGQPECQVKAYLSLDESQDGADAHLCSLRFPVLPFVRPPKTTTGKVRCGGRRRRQDLEFGVAVETEVALRTESARANMMNGLLSALLLLAAVSSVLGKPEKQVAKKEKRVPQTLSRGWGDELIWAQTYEEALFKAKSNNKPLMVILHLEECPHSQALKKAFANSKEIQKLADEDFILLNLVYETTDKHLSPDGQYVPRILFVDPSLTVRADITGRYANRMYAYEPSDINLLINNMQKAKKLLKTEL